MQAAMDRYQWRIWRIYSSKAVKG